MRIAVIADIHGNLYALEAVLKDIAKKGVDEIVIAGDTVSIHPFSKECWDLLSTIDCTLLQGNHEFYVYAYNSPDADPVWKTAQFQPIQWCQALFSESEKATMRTLPWTYQQENLMIVHASPQSLFDSVRESTPVKDLQSMFANVSEDLILRGHNHSWLERSWEEKRLVTLASCGLPLRGRLEAQYAILSWTKSWSLEKRFVSYDREAALNAMNDVYIANVGPIGRLNRRQFETGRPYLSPFLQTYSRELDGNANTLEKAVSQYLLEH